MRGFDRPNIRLAVERFHGEQGASASGAALHRAVEAAPQAGHRLRRHAAPGRGARRTRCASAASAPPPTTRGMRAPSATTCRSASWTTASRCGRHHRVRHGDRQGGRPLGVPREVSESVDAYYQEIGRARPRRRAGRGGALLPQRGPRAAALLRRRRPRRGRRDRAGARRRAPRDGAVDPAALARRDRPVRDEADDRAVAARGGRRGARAPDAARWSRRGDAVGRGDPRRPPRPRRSGACSTARAWT